MQQLSTANDISNPTIAKDIGKDVKDEYIKFLHFLEPYQKYWGAGLIVLGIFLAFFGNDMLNFVIYIVVCLTVVSLLGGVAFKLFVKSDTKNWIQWVILAIVLLIGNIAGFFVASMRKLGIAIIGAFGGVMLGISVNTTFQIAKDGPWWGIVVGAAVICAIVAFFVETIVVIAITSFIGSYFLIRGISMYAGGFPNEFTIHQAEDDGIKNWKNFPKTFYAYLAGIIACTILGCFIQGKKAKGKY